MGTALTALLHWEGRLVLTSVGVPLLPAARRRDLPRRPPRPHPDPVPAGREPDHPAGGRAPPSSTPRSSKAAPAFASTRPGGTPCPATATSCAPAASPAQSPPGPSTRRCSPPPLPPTPSAASSTWPPTTPPASSRTPFLGRLSRPPAEDLPTDEESLVYTSYAVLSVTDPVLAAQPFLRAPDEMERFLTGLLETARHAGRPRRLRPRRRSRPPARRLRGPGHQRPPGPAHLRGGHERLPLPPGPPLSRTGGVISLPCRGGGGFHGFGGLLAALPGPAAFQFHFQGEAGNSSDDDDGGQDADAGEGG